MRLSRMLRQFVHKEGYIRWDSRSLSSDRAWKSAECGRSPISEQIIFTAKLEMQVSLWGKKKHRMKAEAGYEYQ